MSAQRPAEKREGFLGHRALILVAMTGAVAEAVICTLLAPGARPVAPQVTALPSVAAYHDLRWLFADGQSWQAFAAILLAVLLARAALDATLLRLAWPWWPPDDGPPPAGERPAPPGPPRPRLTPPRWGRAFWSCLGLTAVCWALLSPAVTLDFGAALLPFSWPLIGALPIAVSVLLALGHGGTAMAWWCRLPPPRAVGWVLASFGVLSAAAGVIAHSNVAGVLVMVAVTGLFNARAWYGLAVLAAGMPVRRVSGVPARVLLAIPVAPVACLLALALVAGTARLLFTGTIKLIRHPPVAVSVASADVSMDNGAPIREADNSKNGMGGLRVAAEAITDAAAAWRMPEISGVCP
jgi:hypothetical protein